MKLLSIILTLLLVPFLAKSQCQNITRITNATISNINSPYQQTFLNAPSINKLDSLVFAILKKKNQENPVIIEQLIENIGKIQSPNAYALLYNCCCRPINIKHINQFNSLAGILSYYNGYDVLNKYYLNSAFDSIKERRIFITKVIENCRNNEPISFYCDLKKTTVNNIIDSKTETNLMELKYIKKDTTINRKKYHWIEYYRNPNTPSGYGEQYNGYKNGTWLLTNKTTYASTVQYNYINDTIKGPAIEWNTINKPNIIEMSGLLINGVRTGTWQYYSYKGKSKKKKRTHSIVYNSSGKKIQQISYYKNGRIKSNIYFAINGTIWHTEFSKSGKVLIDKPGLPETKLE